MYLHANAKLGLAGRLALVRAIESGAALELNVSVDTIRRAVADGVLNPIRLRERGALRFERDEIETIIAGGHRRR